MRPELVVYPTAEDLGLALATQIADGIEEAAARGERYLLGCPGGRSPRTTYEALVDQVRARDLDLRHLVIVMMDDYVIASTEGFVPVAGDAHYSVARFAREDIVNPLNAASSAGRGVSNDHVWFPDPQEPDRYDHVIRDAGGVDLFIIASGDSDGHVAFNPPGSDADSRTRVVELANTTRVDNTNTFPDFNSLDEVPRFGISVGIATIRELSHRVVLVAPGGSKKMAVEKIATSDSYDSAWPATVLSDCRNPSIYTDRAATTEAST